MKKTTLPKSQLPSLFSKNLDGFFIKPGEILRKNLDYVSEYECSGHICRILAPDITVDEALVIRDDNKLCHINLERYSNIEVLLIQP